ncbi:baseplate wedge subunit [Serratia phage 4S]|nr:baseplate wedge subunit [Serratia phage 4S]
MTTSLKKQVNAIPDVFAAATFPEIKKALIDWLSGQEEFKDYDFLGSRLNVLVDLLAYNTLYIQQFSNSALYESFIYTANLRSSVVQAAQDLGYYPSSKTAAYTTLMVTCTNKLTPSQFTIPRGTKFLATVADRTVQPFTFVTMSDATVQKNAHNDEYVFRLDVAQGRLVRTELLFDKEQPIIIRDTNIDRFRVKVWVNGAEWKDWTNDPITTLGPTSTVFYQRETIDGHTEIYFGEGESSVSEAGGVIEANYIGGLKPTKDDVIVIEYLRTDGEKANGSESFTYADTLQYVVVQNIVENLDDSKDYVGAIGGGEPEDIERIRELAPVKREAQRRCVTASDYETTVSSRFGSIVQAIQCFTDNEKPGYAFIAIKPKQGLRLTSVQREDIANYLKKYNLAPITPSIISPNYLFLTHNIKVTYSVNKLAESEQWLEGKVIDAIDKYYINEVETFNKSFAKSRMLTYVDNADISIIGSQAEIGMVREVDNFFKTPSAGIKYYNQIAPGSVISNEFGFIRTNGDTYNVRYASTKPDTSEKRIAKIVVGPFMAGDVVNMQAYTGTDFEKMPGALEDQKYYYVVGEVQHAADYIYWDLGALDLKSDRFNVASIELSANPMEANIFTRDGSLIVFENDLRPQYTKIKMEPIV